jgi:3-oxoacyl-[acyl-carrier-protein] synthase-1
MNMSSSSLVVTGMGMASSLGLNTLQCCAAARAGLIRTSELDYYVEDADEFEMIPTKGHQVGHYTLGFSELGRLVQLGHFALKDLLLSIRLNEKFIKKTGVIINLASGFHLKIALGLTNKEEQKNTNDAQKMESSLSYEERIPWYESQIIEKLIRVQQCSISPKYKKVLFEDQSGIINALLEAKALLDSGEAEYCIVGGIDSLIDHEWLDALKEIGILKTPTNLYGFIPGEGAGFLLIETYEHAMNNESNILALIKGISLKQSSKHRFSKDLSDGLTLSQVIRDSMGTEKDTDYTIMCNLNGDPVRANEWGYALVKLSSVLNPKESIIPSESFGELGAAYGFVASCMAISSFERNYNKSRSILVWTSSDKGTKGSFILTRDYELERT